MADFAIQESGVGTRHWTDDEGADRMTNSRPSIQSEPIQNRSIGFRLGSVRSYSYGLSNPALRPVVPKGA